MRCRKSNIVTHKKYFLHCRHFFKIKHLYLEMNRRSRYRKKKKNEKVAPESASTALFVEVNSRGSVSGVNGKPKTGNQKDDKPVQESADWLCARLFRRANRTRKSKRKRTLARRNMTNQKRGRVNVERVNFAKEDHLEDVPSKEAYTSYGEAFLSEPNTTPIAVEESRTVAPFREWLAELSPEAKFFTCKLVNLLGSGVKAESFTTLKELRDRVESAEVNGIEYPEGAPGRTVVRAAEKITLPAHSVKEVRIEFGSEIEVLTQWAVEQSMLSGIDIPDRAISCTGEGETLMLINATGKTVKIKKSRNIASMFLLKNTRLVDFMKNDVQKVPMLSDLELVKVVGKLEELEGRAMFTKIERTLPDPRNRKWGPNSSIQECSRSFAIFFITVKKQNKIRRS